MATIQFPDPTNLPDGYTFEAENGVTYTLDKSGGGGWTAYNSESFDDRYVEVNGDTMTGDLTVPNLVATGDVQASSFNGGPLAGFRNQLQNPFFDIRQRGSNFDQTSGTNNFIADRWLVNADDATWSANVSKTNAPLGLAVSYSLIANTLRQAIELPATGKAGPFVNGSQWTLSFWANKATFTNCGLFFREASNSSNMQKTAGQGNFTSTGETSAGFTRYSTTFNIIDTPGSTLKCLLVSINNPTKESTLIAGIQLEPGPVATPLEFRDPGQELQLCQRFYAYDTTVFSMFTPATAVNTRYLTVNWPVTMRVPPTVSVVLSTGSDSGSAPTIYGKSFGVVVGNDTTQVTFTGYTADAEL